MDLWGWVSSVEAELVDAGEHRLAHLMRMLPNRCCDGDHAFVDAVYPEALSLARAYGNSWIEVFVRHWYLQSQVLKRGRGKSNLSEAVSLLEFSTREDCRDCPQSICAVQDLASCYGCTDGPGYAEERITVAKETLERIDPSWGCWHCISKEYFDALVDAGKLPEERAARKRLREELASVGKEPDGKVLLGEAGMEMRAGNLELAEQLACEAQDDGSFGEAWQISKHITLAEILARQARSEEALALLPEPTELIKSPSDSAQWVAALGAIIASKADENTSDRRNLLWALAQDRQQEGCIRDAISIFAIYADLSMKASAILCTEEALDRIDALVPKLARDLGASDDQLERRGRLARMQTASEKSVTDHVYLMRKIEEGDDKANIDELRFAADRWPEDGKIGAAFGRALLMAGFSERACDILRRARDADINNSVVWELYGAALLDAGQLDVFNREIRNYDTSALGDAARNGIDWIVAMQLSEDDLPSSLERLDALLAREGDTIQVLRAIAEIARSTEDHEREIDCWSRAIALESNQDAHWNRILAATLADDWATVRSSACALEIDLQTKVGPIAEDWGIVRVSVRDQDGQKTQWFARRTGPVSATIIQLAPPQVRQLFGAQIIFDPTPLNELDQQDEEGESCDREGSNTYLFEAVRIGNPASITVFDIDGVHPGKDTWANLEAALEKVSVHVEHRSNDDYVVWDLQEDTGVPGLYALVGVPDSVELSEVSKVLNSILGPDAQMIWPVLLEALADEAGLAAQSAVELRYAM